MKPIEIEYRLKRLRSFCFGLLKPLTFGLDYLPTSISEILSVIDIADES